MYWKKKPYLQSFQKKKEKENLYAKNYKKPKKSMKKDERNQKLSK